MCIRDSLATTVEEDIADLYANLTSPALALQEPSYRTLQESMLAAVERYRSSFGEVVVQSAQRSEVLEASVRSTAKDLKLQLVDLLEEAEANGDVTTMSSAAMSLRWLTECSEDLDRHLNRPDSEQARRFAADYRQLAQSLNRLRGQSLTSALPDARELEAWYADGVDVIEKTTAVEHEVNVVMMGEALKFRTLSASLIAQSSEHQQRALAHIAARQDRFRRLSTGFGVLTILAGFLAARWIPRPVARPIQALTTTFSRLAKRRQRAVSGRHPRQ